MPCQEVVLKRCGGNVGDVDEDIDDRATECLCQPRLVDAELGVSRWPAFATNAEPFRDTIKDKMPRPFTTAQGDVAVYAEVDVPAFAFLHDPTPLLRVLHGDLSRFGLRVGDMSFQGTDENYRTEYLLCTVLNYATNIVVRAERTEVACLDVLRVSQDQFVDLVVTALEAVSRCIPDHPYKTYTVFMNLDGWSVDGISTREYLGQFASSAPQGLGPLVGSGTVFYYGPEGERLLSAISGYVRGTDRRLWSPRISR